MDYQVGDIVEMSVSRYNKGVVRKKINGTEYYYVAALEDNKEVGLVYVVHSSEMDKINN